jgi:hypothetical protein
MKNYLLIISIMIFGVASCEKSESDSDPGPDLINQDSLGSVGFFQIGDNVVYDYSEISLYDSSTHILYFKENHPEFEKLRQSSFVFYAEGDTIYEGEIWPGYSSLLPSGPYIASAPFFYQNYALRIEYRQGSEPDMRNDPRIIKSFKDRAMLHSGLQVVIRSLEINGSQGRLSLAVTNMDKSALRILDPDKMGHKLFHYFTNGLYLRDLTNNNLTQSVLEFQTPVPWNGWNKDWLTQLEPEKSQLFTLTYSFDQPVNPGNYLAFIEYPGLSSQVDINELFQSSGRIWLGNITAVKNITIH